MAYDVHTPTDPYSITEREREERAREEVRKHTAQVAEETQRANEQQEALELQQRVDREARRVEREREQREAEKLADELERDERINARARAILAARGYDDDAAGLLDA